MEYEYEKDELYKYKAVHGESLCYTRSAISLIPLLSPENRVTIGN
jgi:hypothetical protein